MEPLHGLLDMLVLRTLVRQPLHGYEIAKAINTSSTEALDIGFGSLYPSLRRLEMKGWIDSRWERSELNRRAKVYRLTAAGKKRLKDEHSQWLDFAAAIARVMGPEPQGRT